MDCQNDGVDKENSNAENSISLPRGVVAAVVIAIFIGSGGLLFDSLIRNPNSDLKQLDKRVHALEKNQSLLTYRINECVRRTE